MANGTITGITSNSRIDAKIEWTSVVNAENNSSTLSLFLYFRRNNTGYTTEGTGTFTLTAGDQSSTSEEVHLKIQESWVLAHSATFIISHDLDGTKEVLVSASGSLPPSSLESVSCSKRILLDEIPKGSEIATIYTSVYFGEFFSVSWIPLDSTHTFSLVLSLGDWTDTHEIDGSSSTEILYWAKVPLEAAEQIPNSWEGDLSVTLFTKDKDGNTIGSDTRVIVAYVPDTADFLPTATALYSPVNEGIPTSFSDLFIQGFSKVKADVYAEAKYGATISSATLVVAPTSFESLTSEVIYSSGQRLVYIECKDTRSFFSHEAMKYIDVLPYSAPKLLPAEGQTAIVCGRCDSNGNLSDSGTYLRVRAKRGYSYLTSNGTQKNFCKLQYRYAVKDVTDFSEWTTILDATETETDEVNAVLSGIVSDVYSDYIVQLRAIDDIGQASSSFETVVPSEEIFSHEIKNGMSYGERAEANTFSVADTWESKLKGPVEIGGVPVADHIVEVGENYRVWKSGRAEAWGEQTVTLSSSPGTSGSFWKTETFTITLPIAFEDAVCVINPSGTDSFVANVSVTESQLTFTLLSVPALLINQQFTVGYHITGIKI